MTERDALVVLSSQDPVAAARAASLLWNMWHRSGDRHLDAILAGGIAAMERQDLAAAEAAFTSLIDAAPAFAESWKAKLASAPAADGSVQPKSRKQLNDEIFRILMEYDPPEKS